MADSFSFCAMFSETVMQLGWVASFSAIKKPYNQTSTKTQLSPSPKTRDNIRLLFLMQHRPATTIRLDRDHYVGNLTASIESLQKAIGN